MATHRGVHIQLRPILSLYMLALQFSVSLAQSTWSITSLTTFSPSGRPGSSTTAVLNTTITEPQGYYHHNNHHIGTPNTSNGMMNPSTAICVATWTWGDPAVTPYNIPFPCRNLYPEDTDSSWVLEVREVPKEESNYPSPTTDFYLWFWRTVSESTSSGVQDTTGSRARGEDRRENITYGGSARFTVAPGKNMEGICSAGGICAFNLRKEFTPFEIQSRRVD